MSGSANIVMAVGPGVLVGTLLFAIKLKQLGRLPSQELAKKIFTGAMEFCFSCFLLYIAAFNAESLCSQNHLPEILFVGGVLAAIHSFYKIATPIGDSSTT